MINLKDWRILITRPEPQCSELAELIHALNGHPIKLPAIAFAPPSDLRAYKQALTALDECSWIIFTSPQAVYRSAKDIKTLWPQFSPLVKIAAIGAGTAKALTEEGLAVDALPANQWNSEGILDLPAFQHLADKQIAIITGEDGRELLEKTLKARGASVIKVVAYQRQLPVIDMQPFQTLLQQGQLDVAICTSYEGMRNLKILFGQSYWSQLQVLPMLVVSDRIKALAYELGFQTIWVAPNASHKAILETLAQRRNAS